MTACVKANSQRVIYTKSGVVTTRRIDDHSPFAMAYNCVNRYLGDKTKIPQRMTITSSQTENGKRFVSISMNEITRKTATELAESKNFEAAFDLADNRKSLHKACENAKRFYNEHILYHNPFPPKQKFSVSIAKTKPKKEDIQKSQKSEDPSLNTAAKPTSSSISLLEGTMSLTSMSSHSQLSATTPSHPINLKTPKKKRSNRFRSNPPDSQMVHKKQKTPPISPKGASDENRLMNTFNTSE
ncbi:hypothetical protein CRE_01943 [Caenorhabditis remanei]|uniref:Uncharacterized protein n=1 Tax=Caenorhabditis remanei TaxID=31234 RepID=E3LGF4_CAERE|nr:hypothetical protein CRE_01943 [Caenorhabditis remanei]